MRELIRAANTRATVGHWPWLMRRSGRTAVACRLSGIPPKRATVVSFSLHAGATEAGVKKGTPCLYLGSKALFQQLYNSWE